MIIFGITWVDYPSSGLIITEVRNFGNFEPKNQLIIFFAKLAQEKIIDQANRLEMSFHLIPIRSAGPDRAKRYQLISDSNLILGMKKKSEKFQTLIFEISSKFDLGTVILVFLYRDIKNLRLLCLQITKCTPTYTVTIFTLSSFDYLRVNSW